jgi:hypothetical protein
MYMFSKEEDCAQCIQQNKDKHIFFVVSNSIGGHFVPRILKAFRKSANGQSGSVYVFCVDTSEALWAVDYMDYVQVFNHELDLLARLTRDIGDYFVILGREQYDYGTYTSLGQSLQYFSRAKSLFRQADQVEKIVAYSKREENVDNHIAVAEARLQQLTNEDEDVDQCILYGEPVDESGTEMHVSYPQDEHVSQLSPLQINVTNTESRCLTTQPDNDMSSDAIKEKQSSQTGNSDDDQQNSSNIRVLLIQPSPVTKNFETIYSILKVLFGGLLLVDSSEQDYLGLVKRKELLAIILSTSMDDELMLEKICSYDSPPPIYLLGHQPDIASEKQAILTKYPPVCAMLNDAEELAAKVAIDVALKSRIMGDRYARNKDKVRANKMYDQCIELLDQLNVLALKNVENKK